MTTNISTLESSGTEEIESWPFALRLLNRLHKEML